MAVAASWPVSQRGPQRQENRRGQTRLLFIDSQRLGFLVVRCVCACLRSGCREAPSQCAASPPRPLPSSMSTALWKWPMQILRRCCDLSYFQSLSERPRDSGLTISVRVLLHLLGPSPFIKSCSFLSPDKWCPNAQGWLSPRSPGSLLSECPGGLLSTDCWAPPSVSDSVGWKWGLRTCISEASRGRSSCWSRSQRGGPVAQCVPSPDHGEPRGLPHTRARWPNCGPESRSDRHSGFEALAAEVAFCDI